MVSGPGYLGDFVAGDSFTFTFTTTVADVPTSLTASPVLAICTTTAVATTSGVSVSANFIQTGMHLGTVNTNGLASGNYSIFVNSGTTGAVTATGLTVGHFSVSNRLWRQDNAATMKLKKLSISSSTNNDSAVSIVASGIDSNGLYVESLNAGGSATSDAVFFAGKRYGLLATGEDGAGARMQANNTGPGLKIGGGTNGNAVTLVPDGTGVGISSLTQTGLVVASGGTCTSSPTTHTGA